MRNFPSSHDPSSVPTQGISSYLPVAQTDATSEWMNTDETTYWWSNAGRFWQDSNSGAEMLSSSSSKLVRWASVIVGTVLTLVFAQVLYTYAGATAGQVTENAFSEDLFEEGIRSGGNVAGLEMIRPHTYTEEEGEYFAMCVGNKNQPVDLQEFFRHHYHHHGVRHFYIGDDGSDPPLSTFNYPGVPREALDFEYYPPEQHTEAMQVDMYNRCAERAAGKHAWMAFFDEDEMLEMTDPTMKVQDFLRGFEDEGAVGVNWVLHGSHDVLTQSLIDDRQVFLSCFPQFQEPGSHCDDNRHIKSIVNMKYFGFCVGPHQFAMTQGKREVGEHHDDIDGSPFRYPDTKDFIQLHHYAVRSLEEYIRKIERGNGMNVSRISRNYPIDGFFFHGICVN